MDEGTGTTIADTSGHSVTGTLVNFTGSFWVAGTPFVSTPLAAGNYGLHLTGTPAASDYVTFGAAPGLGAAQFTIETWFKRDAAGVSTSTGTLGLTGTTAAIPLVTKGRAEADGNNLDMNYFLGIVAATNVLAADFEDMATGLNHPVLGTTAIPADGVWRHAAATYDGTTWRLYLNGALEATLVVGNFTPRFDSIQHASLGSALTSIGTAAGFFAGTLDEARIWNYARSATQIASGKNREIAAASGLLGRWSFNEACGSCRDSSGNNVNGTLLGSSWTWVTGATFSGAANTAPVVDAGPDQTITLPATAALLGAVTDDGVSTPLVITWTKTSGPGPVTFSSPNAASTNATFSTTGTYVLTLTANDGELVASDTVTVVVNGIPNNPPVVDAGPDQTITLPTNVVTLAGTVTDDGVPGTGVTSQWTKVSGSGTVTFGNAAAPSTTATFSLPGSYVLQLSGSDGVLTTTDTATITVNSNPANKAIQFGSNSYVTFGAAPGLGASKFTIETWFRRDGAGVATNTGTGGLVP